MGTLFFEAIPGLGKALTDAMRSVPAFHLTQEQLADLTNARMAGLYEAFPPFPQFAIVPDARWLGGLGIFPLVTDDPDAVELAKNGVGRCTGIVFMSNEEGARMLFGHEIRYHDTGNTVVFVGSAWFEEGGLRVAAPRLTNSEHLAAQESLNKLMKTLAYVAPRFMWLLNHRETRVVEKVMNRAERRQTQGDSKRPNYGIYIPPTITVARALDEVTRGVNVRVREPHMVRGHLRTDRYGRKRIQVKPHARCKKDGIIPEIKSYKAYSLGMESE
jgi:hypothetical protein